MLDFKLDNKNTKMFSRVGSRATFGLASLELAEKIENLMIITSDVSTSAGLDRFRNKYKDKYVEVGIAEQNLIGIAAGMASEDFNVITTTFAPFQTMRCLEQIKVNLGYMKQKVCMVGLASGLVLGTLGYTHCCIEDLGIIRTVPNISVISPADCGETVKALYAALQSKQSTYIRLTGGSNCKIVNNDNYNFQIGKNIILKEGIDITLIANGTMVAESMEAATDLEGHGISTRVVNMHTIKPIDYDNINFISKNSKLIVTIEEHSIIGGLGSAVSETLSTIPNSPVQYFIGVPDNYEKSGNYEFLKKEYNLTGNLISDNVRKKYDELRKI